MQAHSRCVSACCFSDDGKHLATYSSDEAKLNVWLTAQSFLGMGQSQAKCIRQFAVPNIDLTSLAQEAVNGEYCRIKSTSINSAGKL
uniref:Uncharacterized protein n=1 Tax=Trichuris muris TaxID=70415 RepID=A0A5S6Q2K7_TRIMR